MRSDCCFSIISIFGYQRRMFLHSCTQFSNISMQISGSGWFETLLNNHLNVSSHGEIFANETRRESFASIKQILDTRYNLEWTSTASKNDYTTAVGFKWMLNQVNWFLTINSSLISSSYRFVHVVNC